MILAVSMVLTSSQIASNWVLRVKKAGTEKAKLIPMASDNLLRLLKTLFF